MKSAAVFMDWRRDAMKARERLFPWLWKASVLALPWQARLFLSPDWQHVPWDTGRASVYLSWGLLFAAIVFAPPTRMARGNVTRRVGLALVLISLAVGLKTGWSVPVLQLACQWVLLVGFCWTLVRTCVSLGELARWFLLALLPHAALGIWQYLHQAVMGSSWLGIASQDPTTLGVSVVQVAGHRVLRAYGGMPHPNIFGAWMAFGSLLAARAAVRRCRVWAAFMAQGFFAVALVLSFSRGAWIGWLLAMAWMAFANRQNRRVLAVLAVGIMCFGGVAWTERAAIAPRVAVESRLEVKSVDERREAALRGIGAWKSHPWFGVGLGRAAFIGWKVGEQFTLPPPHAVPLVGLVELGLVGMFGVVLGIWTFRPRQGSWAHSGPFLVLITILSFVDHFLWTFWPGQVLLVFLLIFWIFSLDKFEKSDRVDEPQLKRRTDVTGKRATAENA